MAAVIKRASGHETDCAIAKSIDALNADMATRSADQKEADKEKLQVEVRSARLLSRTVQLTGATVLLSVVGTGLSYIGMRAAEKAAKDAHYQSQQAKRQADDADAALKLSERTYIVVSDLNIAQGSSPDTWKISPIIKNAGSTVAFNVSLGNVTPHGGLWLMQERKSACTIASEQTHLLTLDQCGDLLNALDAHVGSPPDPEQLLGRASLIPPNARLSNLSIGPGGSLPDRELVDAISRRDQADSQGNRAIGRFFYGVIQYTDLTLQKHISKYCFRFDQYQTGPVSQPTFSNCSHWNCVDDQCEADKLAYSREFEEAGQSAWFNTYLEGVLRFGLQSGQKP